VKSTICFFLLYTFVNVYAQEDPISLDSPEGLYKGLQYRNIGPFRGGRSVASSGVIGDPLTYYMGSTGGGIWKTTDAGVTWNNISDGQLNTGSVGAIAVSESNANVIYVGMGEHPVRGVMTSHGDGMYKSVDAGVTWHHIGLPQSRHIASTSPLMGEIHGRGFSMSMPQPAQQILQWIHLTRSS